MAGKCFELSDCHLVISWTSRQIIGPTRSGSTWHQDPNGTSAWNAVTAGQKAWLMFPPDITPPGVFVSADQAQVEAPLSLAGESSRFLSSLS